VAGTDQGHADDVLLCHCDFTPDNVFRPAGGGPLVVLDWENAGPMSAEAELALTVSAWIGDRDAAPFLSAYADAGGPATLRGPSSFATSVATFLNYLEVLARHSLDDAGHREFAEPRLDVMLREHLDRVLPRGWDS
jgi:thiamine kinase-like enzyme